MKIALLGAAPSSCKLAPFDDINWEIWACSLGNYSAPRVDAWFEMHSLDRKWVSGNEPYIAALQAHPRVYVSAPDERLPRAILYPKEILDAYGGQYVQSFCQSSVSYMLALAISLKPEKIGLWGIDMAAADEYGQQRPGCHFFFNEADKAGIEIGAPVQSDILEPLPLYGYKEHYPMYWRQRVRKKEIEQRIAEADAKVKAAQREQMMLVGASQEHEYTNNTWLKP
jgi:hypothetical protein